MKTKEFILNKKVNFNCDINVLDVVTVVTREDALDAMDEYALSCVNNFIEEVKRRKELIQSETNELVKNTMIENLDFNLILSEYES